VDRFRSSPTLRPPITDSIFLRDKTHYENKINDGHSAVDAQLITPGTEYTVRVGTSPLTTTVTTGQAHSFTANVVAGQAGPQTIGFLEASGEQVPVQATETFGPFGGGFEFVLSITSEADLAEFIEGSNALLIIGQNNAGSFDVDPDFGGADPPVEFTPSNAAIVNHTITEAVLETYDATTGELRGFRFITGLGAFQDPANSFAAWEGFLGAAIRPVLDTGVDDDGVAGIATGNIGEIRLTLTGSISPVLGDVNLDGVVDFLDISPFITLLTTGEFQFEADINLDDEVDFLDISPFITLLSS